MPFFIYELKLRVKTKLVDKHDVKHQVPSEMKLDVCIVARMRATSLRALGFHQIQLKHTNDLRCV
jgi:hypothetical protein